MKRRPWLIRLGWWASFLSAWATGLSMLITPLKPMLAEHHFGVLSVVASLIAFTAMNFIDHANKNPYPTDDTQDAGA